MVRLLSQIQVDSSLSASQTLFLVTICFILVNLSNLAHPHVIHLAVTLCINDLQIPLMLRSRDAQSRGGTWKRVLSSLMGPKCHLKDRPIQARVVSCMTPRIIAGGETIHQKSEKARALCSQRANKPGGKARSKQRPTVLEGSNAKKANKVKNDTERLPYVQERPQRPTKKRNNNSNSLNRSHVAVEREQRCLL